MMQIVKRGTKGESFFWGGTKKTTSQHQVDIFNTIQKRYYLKKKSEHA